MNLLCFALGTRPEIIKLAPLLRRVVHRRLPFLLVHTDQHFDYVMDDVFFEELGLPQPTHHLHAAGRSHGDMLHKMFREYEQLFREIHPAALIVQGDTNSTFASTFAASRHNIPVAHVEAGLRSFDRNMPEEVNRVLTDQIADRLYAPTVEHAERLIMEGVGVEKILVTGNTIVDAVSEYRDRALSTPLPPRILQVIAQPYAVLTFHRPALVDDRKTLLTLLSVVDHALQGQSLRGILLVHPRTRRQLGGERRNFRALLLHDPIGYLQMLRLLQGAKLIITDAGGLQEEAALLHVPCVTVRKNTERPETIYAGGNRVVGFESAAIRQAIIDFTNDAHIVWSSLYGVTNPSDTILADLYSRYGFE
jgi:UDP-N-acetylglucosamine 2-epimerase (non-hydrolysing)